MTRRWRRRPAMVSGAVVLASGLLMSCGVPDSASEARRLVFSEQEFKIGVNNKSVAAGHIPVRSENHGAIAHELVAFRTDLSEADLPLVDDGTKVDEEGAGITHLDPEAENILPDTAKDITIILRPGRYVFLCNLPTHYKSGMHAVVDVH